MNENSRRKEIKVGISEHTFGTKIDQVFEDIIAQDKWVHTRKNMKAKGYKLVYLDELQEIFLYCESPLQIYVLTDLLNNEVKKDFTIKLDYKKLTKIYNISRSTATRYISFFKHYDVIRGNRGKYDVNPFIVIPKGASDDVVASKQSRWEFNMQFNRREK